MADDFGGGQASEPGTGFEIAIAAKTEQESRRIQITRTCRIHDPFHGIRRNLGACSGRGDDTARRAESD